MGGEEAVQRLKPRIVRAGARRRRGILREIDAELVLPSLPLPLGGGWSVGHGGLLHV